MTCISGLFTKEKRLLLGGDSGGFTDEGSVFIHANGKLFRKGDFLFGCAGSRRFADVLRFSFEPPAPPDAETFADVDKADAFMCSEFVDALRGCLKLKGCLTEDDTNGGDLICHSSGAVIGLKGVGLYYLDAAFSLSRENANGDGEQVVATGGGMKYALGAMLATPHVEPRERIVNALSITEKLYNGIRAPFAVLEA